MIDKSWTPEVLVGVKHLDRSGMPVKEGVGFSACWVKINGQRIDGVINVQFDTKTNSSHVVTITMFCSTFNTVDVSEEAKGYCESSND